MTETTQNQKPAGLREAEIEHFLGSPEFYLTKAATDVERIGNRLECLSHIDFTGCEPTESALVGLSEMLGELSTQLGEIADEIRENSSPDPQLSPGAAA